jgi:hypothetical protein
MTVSRVGATRPVVTGSARARQCVAVILAVLSGDCSLAAASQQLGVSLTRYYGLERQALQAMVLALEHPRERHRIVAASRHQVRLEQEVLRLQALVRATQRAAGVPAPKKSEKRRRTLAPRARKLLVHLRAPEDSAPSTEE